MIYSKINDNTISPVIKDELCTGCGTCSALCSSNAINIIKDPKKCTFVPKINLKSCIHCGTCFNVCPGPGIDFKELNLEIFKEKSKNNLIGNFINSYLGYSKNHDIRYNSSSGGIITQLLIFALNEGIIDGALVTRMKRDNPLEPEPFIARTKKDIIEASKSKYCPVSANIILKEILNAPDNEKFAVVGLPCHIHGVRKAEKINKKIKNKIILHLGLFCNQGTSFEGTRFFVNKIKVNKDEIVDLSYRGDGWPGNFKVVLKDKKVKKELYWLFYVFPSIYFFTPKRCFMCSDALNELADISFGDAWLPEFLEEKNGISIVISRSKKGDQLLLESKEKNEIELDLCKTSKIIESQIGALYFKKKGLSARKRISDFFKIPFTSDNTDLMEVNIFDYCFAILMYSNNFLSYSKYIQSISNSMPIVIIKSYNYLFHKFRSINSRKLMK